MEVAAQAIESALDAFMVVIVDGGDHLLQEGRGRRDLEASLECDQAIDDGPWCHALPDIDLGPEGHQSWVRIIGVTEAVDEVSSVSQRDKAFATMLVLQPYTRQRN